MPTAPVEPPAAPAGAVPFGGTGTAGGIWKGAVTMLATAAVLLVVYSVLAGQVALDPSNADQDARGWRALGAVALASVLAVAAFVVWGAANVVAALGLGRLARPVLALGAVVAAVVAAGCAWIIPRAESTGPPTVFLVIALASLAGAAVALRRATASSP